MLSFLRYYKAVVRLPQTGFKFTCIAMFSTVHICLICKNDKKEGEKANEQ